MRDMNLGVMATDQRRLDVLAQGLPIEAGAQLAIDVTLRAALTTCSAVQGRAAAEDGAVCTAAKRDKEAKYPELVAGSRCKLIVFALEVGG